MEILILGANGFIGSNLCKRILSNHDWTITAIDIQDQYLSKFKAFPNFQFYKVDVSENIDFLETKIKSAEVIFPLIAVAQPKKYVQNPLHVFELTFELNLKVVRLAVKYNKRLIMPSSSEVYGMSDDLYFSEEKTNLTYGPINKSRWIYASSKQLLDRVIYSYGVEKGLRYTIFRPFNWIGPNLDSLEAARLGNSRVLTQFISNLFDNEEIKIVGDGKQIRSFTDSNDAMDALILILQNEKKVNHEIINIGNPNNEISIIDLAILTKELFQKLQRMSNHQNSDLKHVSELDFYGDGFQDVNYRRPNIDKAKQILNWKPVIGLETSITEAITSWGTLDATK